MFAVIGIAVSACATVDSSNDSEFSTSSTQSTGANSSNKYRDIDGAITKGDVGSQEKTSAIKRFFSRETQREVADDGTIYAELETYDPVGRGPRINTGDINKGPGRRERVEFVGSLSSASASTPATAQENATELRKAGAKPFKANERVEIRFDNDPLSFVVKQLLGGLLAVNYVAAADLVGTVTFETEQPILKAEVPTVLRDILARNGFVMKLINGVYQIGSAEVIQQLEINAAAGAESNQVSRVINITRGDVSEIADVIASILPRGAQVSPLPTSNALIVRANPVDIAAVEGLVRTLVESGVADDLVAVIPLNESPPEQVAASLQAYYETRGSGRAPIVLPLENQQAILIGVRSKREMGNVRRLIRGLDKDLRDQASLRIIPLKHLPANEIAEQLNAIFGTNSSSSEAATPRQDEESSGQDQPTDANSGGDRVQAPSIVRSSGDRGQGSPNARRFQEQTASADPLADAGPIASQADSNVSIVPDGRNNALLVFATFAQFKRIREVVRSLDLPLAQVVIEATIVEVTINDALGYGVQAFLNANGISARSSVTTAPADPGTAGGFAQVGFNSFGSLSAQVVLNALQAVTSVQIISSPYLTVLDGRSARLSIGDQVPFLTATSTQTGAGDVTVTNQVEVRDTGIILEVTPRVGADNSVLLNVNQEVSSVVPGGVGSELTPTISQRSINSDIVVRSGKTTLLGGLIQNNRTATKTGLPVLGRVPGLGKLFSQSQKDLERTELLVMITPRVIRKALQLENITRQLRNNLTTR